MADKITCSLKLFLQLIKKRERERELLPQREEAFSVLLGDINVLCNGAEDRREVNGRADGNVAALIQAL